MFYAKDLSAFSVFLTVFFSFVMFAPNSLGHGVNYVIADAYHTPRHVVPEWYFLPFFCILRAIPDKTGGILTMGAAVAVLLLFPLVDFSEIRSPLFRPFHKIIVMFFFSNFLLLGYLGQSKTKYPYYDVSQYATIYHFVFFILVLLISLLEKSLQRKEVFPFFLLIEKLTRVLLFLSFFFYFGFTCCAVWREGSFIPSPMSF